MQAFGDCRQLRDYFNIVLTKVPSRCLVNESLKSEGFACVWCCVLCLLSFCRDINEKCLFIEKLRKKEEREWEGQLKIGVFSFC